MLNAIHDKMHKALAHVGGAHRRGLLLPAHRRLEVRMPQAQAGHAGRDRQALQRGVDGRALHRRFFARPAGGRGRRRAADAGADRKGREDVARRQFPEEHRDLSRPRLRGVGAAGRRAEPAHATACRRCAPSLFLLFQIVVTPLYAVGDAAPWSGRRASPRYGWPRAGARVNLVGRARDLRHPLAGRRRSRTSRRTRAPHRTS